MKNPVLDQIDRYQPHLPLEEASTCPALWYVDPRILELEQRTTFARTWQYACRVDQVREPGDFVTLELAGEPLAVVRGSDGRTLPHALVQLKGMESTRVTADADGRAELAFYGAWAPRAQAG